MIRLPVAIGVLCPALLVGALCVAEARAENWPQWRGPQLNGISSETDLPVKWSKTENVAWRLPLPGPAGSTPVVWDDRIFLTTVDGEELLLVCVSTKGEKLWQQLVGRGNKVVRGGEGNTASPSPSTDGKHVWTFMGNGLLACYTIDGDEVWKLDVQDRYGRLKIDYGMTTSPLLDGDRLYLQLIHGDGNPNTREATVVCLDGATGAEIWKHARASDARNECESSYASPTLYRDDQREFLITHGADFVVAHSLEDGHELWRCGGLNSKTSYNPTLRFVASPVAVPGYIVVPSAKRGPVICLKPDISGDVTDNESAYHWIQRSGTPDVPSPLVHDRLVYMCSEEGVLSCVEAESGKQLYKERTSPGFFRASPVYGDGKVYVASRNGMVTVVKEGEKFEVLSQNDMEETLTASPAISNGRIYLRTYEALYAIE